jgi:hypothetical protein
MSGGYDAFKFAVGGTVSPIRRIAAADAARQIGIASFTVWSGVEFEENLHLIGEDLLRRFCEGESFPDRPEELRQFANDFPGLADHDALEQMAAVFQRPALETPFHQESSLPDFRTAIEDTIRAINTGIWRTREGETIRRIPSVHHLRDPKVKAKVKDAIDLVDQLRRILASGLRDGKIKRCGCDNQDCPVFTIEGEISHRLDEIRREVQRSFQQAVRLCES